MLKALFLTTEIFSGMFAENLGERDTVLSFSFFFSSFFFKGAESFQPEIANLGQAFLLVLEI